MNLEHQRMKKPDKPRSEKIGSFLIKNRVIFLLGILALTGFFFQQARQIQVRGTMIDRFPSDHPYVKTFEKYKDIFGGASMVAIQLEVDKGDIFNTKTLEKIKRITKALELLPAINNYQVTSIAQKKIKRAINLNTNSTIRGVGAVTIMWPDVPQTEEGLARLRHNISISPQLHGTLVSLDNKAALIIAGFFTERMDPKQTYDQIAEILAKETDGNTRFSVIGSPIALGYILKQSPQLVRLFFYSILSMIAVLTFYFRDVRGVLIPVATALMSAIWGLGFLVSYKPNSVQNGIKAVSD